MKSTNDDIERMFDEITEAIQTDCRIQKKIYHSVPFREIKSQVKANADFPPWKKFLYFFLPCLKRRALLRAKTREANCMDGIAHGWYMSRLCIEPVEKKQKT